MSSTIEQISSLPEVQPVFEFRFTLDLDESAPSHQVSIECLADPDETHDIVLNVSRPTKFALSFTSGHLLEGELEVLRGAGRESFWVAVDANLQYWMLGQSVGLRQHFQGVMFRRQVSVGPPDPPLPPTPPLPPCPDPPDDGPPVIRSDGDELFPYVYVRGWPSLSGEALRYGFYDYVAQSPPASGFVTALASAKAGGREGMTALATDFVEGVPPYAGIFVEGPQSLPPPLRGYAPLAGELHRSSARGEAWTEELWAGLGLLLAESGETAAYLESSAYFEALDRVWESYFALLVLLGYDLALLTELALTLWLANAARMALAVEGRHLRPAGLSDSQVRAVSQASVRLPADLFPMPPATGGDSSPPADPARSWVAPYAVGDLQMVRQRLVGYGAGEIARIENVMRGERREVSSRSGRSDVDLRRDNAESEQRLDTDGSDQRTGLLEEASRTVAGRTLTDGYTDFTATYGPPTQANLSGTRTRQTVGGPAAQNDVTRFAREILSKTVNRISRKVSEVRATRTTSHVEDAIVSVVDNCAGGEDVCAIYRWVNKIYEARVVNYGTRLMIEFIVPRPGEAFRAASAAGEGRREITMPSPASQHVHSFKDIERDNYASLCATYGITDVATPPATPIIVSSALRSGTVGEIAIPAGYVPRFAAACAASASPPMPDVILGCHKIEAGPRVELNPHGESPSLAVSVAEAAAPPPPGPPPAPAPALAAAPPPPPPPPPPTPEILVNVLVECWPGVQTMNRWRIDIYGAIVAAYRKNVERRAEARAAASQRSPLSCREIEKQALRRACTRVLLDHAAGLTGALASAAASSPPYPAGAAEPRYLQFLNEALEWREMSYSFIDGEPEAAPHSAPRGVDDTSLTRFMRADQARVLLPATPDRGLAFLYFFASGMICDIADWLVPVNDEDVDIADDLKRASRGRGSQRPVGRPWEVVVPTAMQVLEGRMDALRGLHLARAPQEDLA